MALSVHRPLEQLAADITRWLDATRDGPHELIRCDRPSEGLSSETLLCETRSPSLESSWAFVVRLPPTGDGAFPEYDLGVQAEAQRVAAAHGVPVPTPVEHVTDPSWLGSPFLVAPMVSGHVPASMPLFDKWVTKSSPELQRRVYDALIDQVAAIHRIDGTSIDAELPERDIDQELAHWRRYLDWYADGERVVPELDDALAWCADHRPADDPPAALLWGDVRLGNVIYGRRPLSGRGSRLGDGDDRRAGTRCGVVVDARGDPGRAVRPARRFLSHTRRDAPGVRRHSSADRYRTWNGSTCSPWCAARP